MDSPESPQLADSISPQLGEELDNPVFHVPWGHHKLLIDKFRDDPDSAMFYVRETVKNGWSRAVLLNFLDTKLHERQGKAVSNFAVALPEADSDLVQEITKDHYCFDFITLTHRNICRRSGFRSTLSTHSRNRCKKQNKDELMETIEQALGH